uniref:7-cyano-7-deazaguanine synthase n=1 Tax=Thermodesulfovibrio aggregans TaxID=86166 RepID=A0A7C4EPF0_9BACT
MKKAVILLSGGIDSSTTLAVAKSEGYLCYALSFDYGQRHKVELESAKKVAKHIGVQEHLTVSFDLRKIGGSALTSEIEVPKGQVEGIPVTYVPARNTIFLSFALAWAEVLEASDIFIGANIVDYSGYPDCRPEYLQAFEEMANLATKVSLEGKIRFKIRAPLIYMTKAQIIKKGAELGVDYSLTWSCYDPQGDPENPFPCFKCPSCIYRKKGFDEAGIKDPLLR